MKKTITNFRIFATMKEIFIKKTCLFLVGFVCSTILFAQSDPVFAEYPDLFYAYTKGTKLELSNEILSNFIRDLYPDEYQQHAQNEFEWHDILNKYRTEISSKVSNINLTEEYFFPLNKELGEYNFEKEGFNVKIDERISFIPRNKGLYEAYSKKIDLYMPDISKYNFFKIGKDDANNFLKSRAKTGGSSGTANVDRKVILVIFFTIIDYSSAEYANYIRKKILFGYPVVGKINKIEVYDGMTKIGDLTKL
jgi:hypothetical protein